MLLKRVFSAVAAESSSAPGGSQKRFGQTDAGFNDLEVRRGQGGGYEVLGHRTETFERPKGVEPRFGGGALGRQVEQRRNDGTILLEHEKFLRGVTPPTVGVGEVVDPLLGRFVEHAGLRPGLEIFVGQSVDATESDFLFQIVREYLFT